MKVMHRQNQILALELDSILIIYTESFYQVQAHTSIVNYVTHFFSNKVFFFLAGHSHCVLHCDLPALCSLLSSISDVIIDISGEELYFERSAQVVFHLIKHLSLCRFHLPGYTDGRKMAFSQLSTAPLERQSPLSENWMIETSLPDEPSLQRQDGAAHFDYQRAVTILLPPEAHTQPSTPFKPGYRN